MKVSELEAKLIEIGCNPDSFAIGHSKHDAICIRKHIDEWIVYYSERGKDSEPMFSSVDECDAAKFFYREISNQTHLHLVGFFKHERDAEELQRRLLQNGIAVVRNDIPAYQSVDDPRFRVFVKGRDVFLFRELEQSFNDIDTSRPS